MSTALLQILFERVSYARDLGLNDRVFVDPGLVHTWCHGMSTALLQILFEGVRGVSYAGDIALDDITLPLGSCSQLHPTCKSSLSVTAAQVWLGLFGCMQGEL